MSNPPKNDLKTFPKKHLNALQVIRGMILTDGVKRFKPHYIWCKTNTDFQKKLIILTVK